MENKQDYFNQRAKRFVDCNSKLQGILTSKLHQGKLEVYAKDLEGNDTWLPVASTALIMEPFIYRAKIEDHERKPKTTRKKKEEKPLTGLSSQFTTFTEEPDLVNAEGKVFYLCSPEVKRLLAHAATQNKLFFFMDSTWIESSITDPNLILSGTAYACRRTTVTDQIVSLNKEIKEIQAEFDKLSKRMNVAQNTLLCLDYATQNSRGIA